MKGWLTFDDDRTVDDESVLAAELGVELIVRNMAAASGVRWTRGVVACSLLLRMLGRSGFGLLMRRFRLLLPGRLVFLQLRRFAFLPPRRFILIPALRVSFIGRGVCFLF